MSWAFKFFSRKEVECKCGCGGVPQEDFLEKLTQLRLVFNAPLPVTSGFRCPKYNAKVSSTGLTGPHTTGRAVDISIARGSAYRLLSLAAQWGFTGIGLQQKGSGRFVHLDDLPDGPNQPRPTIWTY